MGARSFVAGLARRLADTLDRQEPGEREAALRNQVKFTEDLIDSVPVSLVMRDASGKYLFVNRTWEKWFGASRDQVVGRRVQDRVSPEVARRVLELDRATLERGPGGVMEVDDYEHHGRHYTQTRSVMADDQGKVLGVLSASLDTTERRDYEARLAERAKFISDLLEALPVSVTLRDTEGRFLQVNKTWERYLGIRREDALGKRFSELPGWKDDPELAEVAKAAEAVDREALARGPDDPLEPMERLRKGRILLNTRRAFLDTAGRPAGVLTVSFDITERRAIEQALATEQQRLALVVRATQAGIVDWDTSAGTIWYSERFKELVGHPADADTSGWASVLQFVHPEDHDRVRAAFVAELRGKNEALHEPIEFRLLRADRSTVWVQSMGLTQRGAAGRATRYIAAITDISARRAQEDRLHEQIALTQTIVAQTPNAIFAKDAQGRFTLANRGWSEMSGVPAEKAVGRTVHELYPPELANRFAREDEKLIAQGAAAAPMESVHQGPRPGQYRIVRKAVLSKDDGTVLGLVCSSTDISELKRIEAELRDQMVLTSALFDSNPNAMYLKDTQGRYVTVNDAWLKMVGVTREAAIGRNVLELFPEKESQRYHGEDMRLIAQGEGSSEMESQRTGPGGEPQWVIIRKRVLRRADGSIVGLIGTNTDITELKRIESELEERAKFIGELVDAMPISVAMRDTEGRYVLVNRTWERYFGVSREDAIGRRRRELPGWQADAARREDAREIEDLDRDILQRGPDYVAEPQETLRLGRHYLITRRALFDSGGKPIGVVSAGIDHTERRAMEHALDTERERLALLVRSTKSGFGDWDSRTGVTVYSPRFKEMLGYPPDADTGSWPSFFEFVHPDEREQIRDKFREMLRRKKVPGWQDPGAPLEYRLRRADGSYIWVHAEGISQADDTGRTVRFITSYSDVTQRRAQEEALKDSVRLREEVERMSRHDLKTPLNSVIAVSRLLREGGKLSREDEELLSIVERAGYRILSMVNLSLDLYRMESGTYQFHPQAIDLADVARKVAADLEGQAASKNVALRLRQSGRSAARAEELLCYSMLANLVKNAIEAVPESGVVSVTVEGAGDTVAVHVHNAGAVPAAVRARFFDKYASSGKSAGLGLGTYSARLMARVQEGDITLHTSETEGTTVSVRLGAAAAPVFDKRHESEANVARAERLPELAAQRVLVVDDDEFNRLVLRRYLPSPPLTLAMAVNGRAALDAARADWPDVVLLDLEMPVMDGYEAARKLREMEKENARSGRKRLTIVAISSNDDESIVRRALEAGCDHYLVKPAPRETLFRLLAGESVFVNSAKPSSDGPAPTHLELDPRLRDKVPAFLESRRALLGEAAAAIGAADRAALRRCAHRLAGSLALFGFDWASAKSRSVEHEAEKGELAELGARLAAVRAHLDTVEIGYREKEEERR